MPWLWIVCCRVKLLEGDVDATGHMLLDVSKMIMCCVNVLFTVVWLVEHQLILLVGSREFSLKSIMYFTCISQCMFVCVIHCTQRSR
jgi:hypothetical protein